MPAAHTGAALFIVVLLAVLPHALLAPALKLESARTSASDLEITGLVPGLTAGSHRFVRYGDLVALPLVTTAVGHDESFDEMRASGAQVTGLPLPALEHALGVSKSSDLVSARCADGYEAHFPADYVAAHQPMLVLEADGKPLDEWARQRKGYNPGPYMITNPDFQPAFSIHAHQDRAQEPEELVALEFTTQARVFGALAPGGGRGVAKEEQAGFVIARQNCLRCHGLALTDGSRVGGTKSQRSWQLLSRFAVDDPKTFAAYVRNPKSVNPRASMPPNPEYDGPTLAALTAYFRAFSGS